MKDALGHGSDPRGGAQAIADQHGVPTEHLQPQTGITKMIGAMWPVSERKGLRGKSSLGYGFKGVTLRNIIRKRIDIIRMGSNNYKTPSGRKR